jgi:putative ABC transport system substrate-binding protein
VSILSTELGAKRLDLLRQLAPRVRHVAFIVNLANPGSAIQLEPMKIAAKTLNIKLEVYNARNAQEVRSALHAIPWKSIDGVLIGGDGVFLAQGAEIAQAVHKARLPAVFPWREFHKYGVLMSYSPDLEEVMRRGAYYVDKILKGAKPSDLPVEQISKVGLIIDVRVAREQGIKVPQELLYRADEVIR